MNNDKEREDELWKQSFLLIADNFEKEQVWKDGASTQFQEVIGRLIVFQLQQIAEAELDYPAELIPELRDILAEMIKGGYYIYCAEAIHITGEYKDIFSVKPYDDPGLKDYLIKELQPMIDGKEIKPELEPPTYVFNTVKSWWKFWITKVLPDNKAFIALHEENRAALLTRVPMWINTGYVATALQKKYRVPQHKHSSAKRKLVGG